MVDLGFVALIAVIPVFVGLLMAIRWIGLLIQRVERLETNQVLNNQRLSELENTNGK